MQLSRVLLKIVTDWMIVSIALKKNIVRYWQPLLVKKVGTKILILRSKYSVILYVLHTKNLAQL
ncbi:hypothetical protein ASV31_22575 [Enterobacter hormaechei subsp. hoffmannii]|nr:hypothetical protein SS58_20830 [Enterobacter hormaechei subsp. hoffmannii]KJN83578.1 hypothetical protein SS04_21195 [Enterobacter hormaechei subsp. hoffmannii]KJN85883.1 hypothetical protein SS05_20975 [Enterobacter hormaechei subsp. hoffmannii]KJN98331.1 hypothetical protein SS03_21185 [Enterobacter hormaechei subsp. hoffmannii]KJO10399.1 hypothetical protein SR87_22150 [Enterobacter hormaechei subsp. hoffmannii]